MIHITRWLRQQVAVWRFVGFVSTMVGLVCYGLSSSFNYLFGDWNLFKIFLYSVFSLFICLWSLLAKAYQFSSTSLLFKAHSAFLVLTITSVYSYFADNAVNGTPDVYSVISCAAFAIMSLCLSRRTQCGFEVDLFYFFLACLMVLLMKIKLALVVVGVGFSYALVILRTSLDDEHVAVVHQDAEHSVVIDLSSQLARTDHIHVDAITTHDLSQDPSLEFSLGHMRKRVLRLDLNLTPLENYLLLFENKAPRVDLSL